MSTLALPITDAAIKRHQNDGCIKQLSDTRHPIKLRYRADRSKASWYFVAYQNGKADWRKIGNYPAIGTKALLQKLPDIQVKFAVGEAVESGEADWSVVADVLNWYLARVKTSRNLSKKRIATTKSAITKHLIPCIGKLTFNELSHRRLDDELIWPLQAQYSLANVRLILSVLKVAFKQAAQLSLIERDYMAGFKFGDFIKAKIAPKGAALRAESIPDVMASLANQAMDSQVLIKLMLMFGTRIGETRQARWADFDLVEGGSWHIPAENTKTGQAHRLPLTDQALAVLVAYRDQNNKSSAFLFPSATGRTSLGEAAASKKVRQCAQGKWTAHDLRKLARTCWADLGIDYMVGELLLNHAMSKLDKTYIHTYAEKQMREALVRWHGLLSGKL